MESEERHRGIGIILPIPSYMVYILMYLFYTLSGLTPVLLYSVAFRDAWRAGALLAHIPVSALPPESPHGTHPFARSRAAHGPALRALAPAPRSGCAPAPGAPPCTRRPVVESGGLAAQLLLLYLNTHRDCQTGSTAARSGKMMVHQRKL